MTQTLAAQPIAAIRPAPASPMVWGLDARQLHDAYWRARGVDVVRLGQRHESHSGAELYLLIERDQLVLFDLADLTERLTWHNAVVTRLRLMDARDEPYFEQVVTDAAGWVTRIERRYQPRISWSYRIAITKSQRIARLWTASDGAREGWDRARRSVAWSRVDHQRRIGRVYRSGDPQDEGRFLNDLIERWPQPDQVIDGIEQIEPGLWRMAGDDVNLHEVRVGPLWIGHRAGATARECTIGPGWLKDGEPLPQPDAVTVRSMDEVELAEQRRIVAARKPASAFLKRSLDVIASAAALIVLSPVIAVIGAMIWLEDGRPLLFGHMRQTRGGKPFRCWKFRTMHRDSERIVRELQAYNISDGKHVYIPNDPRVTRVGRWLRATHLDEVPQLWNVLVGQMSLVGPRPSPEDENQLCPAWRELRLSVRPGITGLWQIMRTRRPGEDFQEWIKYDVQYVRHASFWFDMEILARTAWMLMTGRSSSEAE